MRYKCCTAKQEGTTIKSSVFTSKDSHELTILNSCVAGFTLAEALKLAKKIVFLISMSGCVCLCIRGKNYIGALKIRDTFCA